ncbi:MAG: type II secretion system protein [Bdellovibrionales bacterium]|nr:type II secretion system protein [Bdellovibrionales bacterium]
MPTDRIRRSCRGFSLIELIIALSLVAILVGTAIPNFRSVRQRSQEAAALSDYRNLKTVALDVSAAEDSPWLFIIGSIVGPRSVPFPLGVAKLSDGVRLENLLRLRFPPTGQATLDYLQFEVAHENGRYRNRYISFNGAVLEQKLVN